MFGPDGELFWRHERILRLSQLATFGPWLPRWATSRWLLELVLQELGPTRSPALSDALRVVEDIHGGWDHVRRPAGEDPRIKVVDHDWIFRQVALYEFGAIKRFLRHGSPDLIAGADRIHEWARTPIGGFHYVERRSAVTVWEDLMTGDRHETANIGSAALLVVGEFVIGRLVPIDDGRMFETVPMRVPEDVARAVAAEPGRWIDVLREALKEGAEIDTGGFRFGFLTDVPVTVSVLTMYDDLELLDRYPERAAQLRERVRQAFAERPTDDPEVVDVWACVATEILNWNVFHALVHHPDPADADLFNRLAETLAEPAATLCRDLARHARGAA